MSGPGTITSVPNFDKLQVVQAGNASISSNGSTQNWSTVPHNLGYRPFILAFLDEVGLGAIFSNGDLPLPTFLDATINTTDDRIEFDNWLFCAADNTNSYFILLNSTGATIETFAIRYYLLRERSG